LSIKEHQRKIDVKTITF